MLRAKVIEVESMTGDCPDEWVRQWIADGYDLIHFIGNGCDAYTRMDQKTIVTGPAWEDVHIFEIPKLQPLQASGTMIQ